ncbi:Ca(2+)-dependent cysteine protease [Tephrocybe rancida]|nr:Ca(2+)-dependent cysteine protease [Tephrocybe rancida]
MPQYERTVYYGPNPPPMQSFPISPSYAPSYVYPPPMAEKPQRPLVPPHHNSKLHKHPKAPTPTKHSSDKPLPIVQKPPHQVHQSQSLGPLNSHFQYSKCTGRKKALCIGINYQGQPNELRGCINDAKHVRDFLISKWGYRAGDIVLLSDDSTNPRQRPTRQNVLDAMRWLVRGAKAHDSLFFHYSGHGGQTKDLNGDELDGFDEVIYPMDFKKAGHIIDDEMHDIMVKPLPSGCRLTALFDCCHSGTVLDLPYIYSSHGRLKGSQVTDRMRRLLATPADVDTSLQFVM